MCSPEAIAVTKFAFQVASAKAEYDDQKRVAALQRQRNEEARKSYNKQYLADLAELDRKRQKELRDVAIKKEATERDVIKDQAKGELKALESGNANVEAVLRDIGFDFKDEFNLFGGKIEDVNTQTLFGYDDAYNAMSANYAKLPTPVVPSKLGLALKIGGSGIGTYGDYKGGKYGEV